MIFFNWLIRLRNQVTTSKTDVSEEDVTIVPMKTCFELLLDVNPGASIQLDGAARLIRKCHNSTLEIHHVCHVRSKLSHVAVTVSITLQYLNGPEVYHFAQEKYFFLMRGKLGHVRSLTKKFLAFYIKN